MSKVDKSKLTTLQKTILFQEETEPPGSSSLNYEKGKAIIFVLVVEQNFLSPKQNMKVEVAGHLFLNLYPTCLKQK